MNFISKIQEKLFIYISFLIIVLNIIGCSFFNDEKYVEKSFGDGKVFYKENISGKEADKLGNYFLSEGIFKRNDTLNNGSTKVYLNKDSNTYQIKFIIKEGIEKDKIYTDIIRIFAVELSDNVFDNNKVEIHLCDENLRILKVLKKDTNKLK
ncbi:MAG: hypothetical protein A2X12_11855 [Bacteroidetes bacterium GWE2_29_8]|nr:MAG: hypothetical protein A2X12_11855 [Bacteroidetes bacterium GWE2_29_8]OFY16602.1 MAG: hypothetical protein A2X02_05545 [Bacteroidetes bacterium GWF2_29_10]